MVRPLPAIHTMLEPRARGLLSVPGVVLLACLFLPAMRVCNEPTAPISFPPCYGAYFGGIGILIMAFANRKRLLAVGASITPVLGIVSVGGILTLMCLDDRGNLTMRVAATGFGALTIGTAIATVRYFLRNPPSSKTMAAIVVVQGLGSTLWASILAFDRNGMWGADVTAITGAVIVLGGLSWLVADAPVQVEAEPVLPRAISLPSERPSPPRP
jgi:hypothetical protein